MKTKTKKEADAKLMRAAELLNNLVVAVETNDMTDMENAAGAGREFLDTDGER